MFGISVSGIKNSQKHINVTSNNIANANSFGFKKSRAEFADVYANSIYSNNRTAAGMGVQNTVVAQQFVQGALSGDTGNSLDMAIQGNGFFVLSPGEGSSHSFTRNGAFQVDKFGNIVTATGEYLQGWDVNTDGSSTSLDLGSAHNIQIPSDTGAPHQSNNIGIGVNLPADKDPIAPPDLGNKDPVTGKDFVTDPAKEDPSEKYKYGVHRNVENGEIVTEPKNPTDNKTFMQYFSNFDPKDSRTYTASTSQTIHDSLGREHTLTYYIIKAGPDGPNSNNTVWNVIPYVDGKPVDIARQPNENPVMISVPGNSNSSVAGANFFGFQIKFDSSGEVINQIPKKLQFVNGIKAGPDGTAEITKENSLRLELFGTPNAGKKDDGDDGAGKPTIIEGAWDKIDNKDAVINGQFIDRTFENIPEKDAGDGSTPGILKKSFYEGSGALHSAFGLGIDPTQELNLTFNATQYGSSNFNVTDAPWNDGYATGLLLSINVNEDGIIQAEYSNGQMVNIAKVALADFTNPQGLSKIGDTQWKASNSSGPAVAKEANVGSAGSIKGANLELSNVDLTSELVELITAQRNYQANAQALQTNNTVMDSILNIR